MPGKGDTIPMNKSPAADYFKLWADQRDELNPDSDDLEPAIVSGHVSGIKLLGANVNCTADFVT
jgi:hypothetical protein